MKSISMKTTVTVILLLWSYILRAQSGEIGSGINKLELKGSSNVELLPSTDGKSRYEIEGDDNHIKVTLSDGKMLINFSKPGGKVKVYASQFTNISITDMSKLKFDNAKLGNVEIETKDASRINGELDADNLTIGAKDASTVSLKGKANKGTINTKDAATVNLLSMDITTCTLNSRDASKACVYTSGKLEIEAEDMSKVCYRGGDNSNVEIRVKGMASAKPASEGEMGVFTGDEDTVRIKFGGKRIMIIKDENFEKVVKDDMKKKRDNKEMKGVWSGFELGMNSFVTPDLSFNQDPLYSYMDCNIGKSWFYGLNFLEKDLHLVRNKVALTTGLGVEWSNFRLKSNSYLAPGVDILFPITDSIPLTNNRMRSFNINVPVLLKFAPQSATRNNGGFHIAAGVILSYTPLVSQRLETKSSGYEQETWTRDDFNVNPFRATATVRVGYGWLRMFANYSLTPYFSQKAGPDIRHFAAGITLIPFS